jgi:hypothetical protein
VSLPSFSLSPTFSGKLFPFPFHQLVQKDLIKKFSIEKKN